MHTHLFWKGKKIKTNAFSQCFFCHVTEHLFCLLQNAKNYKIYLFKFTIRLKSFSLASMEVEVYLNYKFLQSVRNLKFIQECLKWRKKIVTEIQLWIWKELKNSLL